MLQKTPEELRFDFWKADLERGGIIRRQYDEIKRVLQDKDMAWVHQRLAEIKQHAIEQTDFYKDYKISDSFPVVNKTILIENRDACMAKGGYQTPTHVSSTSGSTGTPFSVIQDFKKRNRTIADLKVFGELCDYPSHERMIFFRVINAKLHRTPEQEDRENIYYIDSSDLGDTHLEEMKNAILDKKPRIVFSYASTLVELAKYIDRTGIPDEGFSMKSVLTAGEGISEENRHLLERVFKCTVYRRYSDMELGILGQDQGHGSEYILNWGSYYFECLKMDSDEPTGTGEAGRIVITDLFNYAFPMIRYDTGDLGVMEYSDNGEFPKLKEIYGRVRDCVYTVDGRLISPAKIFVMMWGSDGVKQWQFIQEDKDLYVLKLNCDAEISTDAYVSKFKDLLGDTAIIKVEFVDEIPVTSSNKRRAVICNYHKE
jgi:phenylacetate-CoA ligase